MVVDSVCYGNSKWWCCWCSSGCDKQKSMTYQWLYFCPSLVRCMWRLVMASSSMDHMNYSSFHTNDQMILIFHLVSFVSLRYSFVSLPCVCCVCVHLTPMLSVKRSKYHVTDYRLIPKKVTFAQNMGGGCLKHVLMWSSLSWDDSDQDEWRKSQKGAEESMEGKRGVKREGGDQRRWK